MSLTLALWCLVAGVDAGVPADFEWKVPGVVDSTSVGRQTVLNGLPMTIVAARSTRPLDELLTHYAVRFVEQGFFIPPRIKPLGAFNAPRVMAYDPVGRRSYLVYGWREADHTTTLILGSANLGARKPSTGEGVPVFPGAKAVARFELEVSRAVSFEVNATEAEVLDFYRTTLGAAGWSWQESSGTFVRQGRALEVLSKVDDARKGVLGVVVLEQPEAELPTAK